MFSPVDPKIDFPEMEKAILDFWKKNRIFELSIEERSEGEEFTFYDGPPFATGLPHFGHFVPGVIKDVIPRYKTMRGYRVHRRFGWDCHGLPVEYEMEKELGISGRRAIEEYGITRFNEACSDIVLRYTREWEEVITRLGRWVDFKNDYKTMEPDYMESIWWVVSQLWQKSLLYRGHYILPYCPRCSTVLSNHELNMGGYREIHDPAITVKMPLADEPNTYFLAWTTTPWTLPSNLALSVGEEIIYVVVEDGGERYIMAEGCLQRYYKSEEEYSIVAKKPGRELLGVRYKPLFPYFESVAPETAFRIYPADYVTTEEGTGIVHTAPGFGEDDYNTLQGTGIPTVCPIDDECRFTDEVSDYTGMFVRDANKEIIQRLKSQGAVLHRENYLHSYPHCWRCKNPLIYRAISSWFVDVQSLKARMLEVNDEINWVPSHLQKGRFGKWLENAKDWAISRNRYWGNPIPIWECGECGEQRCIGSRKELEEATGRQLDDLHKHHVDKLTIPCSCGGTMNRIPEVLDCWFESGSMPYGYSHYPFEDVERFNRNFPADFISEGIDQTRGWFYTLTVLATALFDSPPFQNVVVNGLVLAEDGKKMSKSERNYSDPMEVMEKFGADSLRLFLMNSTVVRGESMKYSDRGVVEILKGVLLPLWNAYSFFVTYANIDNISPTGVPADPSNPLDRWILSERIRLMEEYTSHMEEYELQKAIQPILEFIDNLNNWYIRRSRRRFWKSENDLDKTEAYETLYFILVTVIHVAAPFVPFITEEIYQNLRAEQDPLSIHLSRLPDWDSKQRELSLERKMRITKQAVSMGRSLRSTHSIKIRQPIKAIHIVTLDVEERESLVEMEEFIREELNVKEVVFGDNEESLVEYRAKANYRVLGSRLGGEMKRAAEEILKLTSNEIGSVIDGELVEIELGSGRFAVTKESIEIQRMERNNLRVLNDGTLTIALDLEMTETLKREGLVRDLVRLIQTNRKESGLEVTDRIRLYLSGGEYVESAVNEFCDYLCEETLCNELLWKHREPSMEVECGGRTLRFFLEKI